MERMIAVVTTGLFVIASLPVLPATGYAEAEGIWLVKTKGSKTESTLWQDGSITRKEAVKEEKLFENRSPLAMQMLAKEYSYLQTFQVTLTDLSSGLNYTDLMGWHYS